MSVSRSHNAHSCLCADLYGVLLLISFSLIAHLSFMVYLFGTKSIEIFQLSLQREDAVYIMLLCKCWTERSTWEHQAWCWVRDTRGLFAELAASYSIFSQLDATAWLKLWEGQELQTELALRHCGLGNAGAHIQYLAEEGQEHFGQWCGSCPWWGGTCLSAELSLCTCGASYGHTVQC